MDKIFRRSRKAREASARLNLYLFLDDLPALHHEPDVLDRADVLQRIARDRDDIGELARLYLPDLAF